MKVKNENNDFYLQKEEKFKEFLEIMKVGKKSKGTMSWGDNIIESKIPKKKIKKVGNNKITVSEINSENLKAGVSNKRVHIVFDNNPEKKNNENLRSAVEEMVNEKNEKNRKKLVNEKEETKEKTLSIDEKRLYVINLPFNCEENDVKAIFSKYGEVTSIKMPKDKAGKFKGFAYVSYSNNEEAIRAFGELDNKIIYVRIFLILIE